MAQRTSYPAFIGSYVTRREKARLALFAAQQEAAVSAMIREFIAREATKPLINGAEVQASGHD